MTKKTFIVLLSLISSLLLISCRGQEPGELFPPQQSEDKELPAPPSKSEPPTSTPVQTERIPVFQVSPGWQVNPDNPEMMRLPNESWDLPIILNLLAVNDEGSEQAALDRIKVERDKMYHQQFCKPGAAEKTFTNCAKGFHKISQEINGWETEILLEYGTWEDADRPIYHIFLAKGKKYYYFMVEGDIKPSEEAIIQIVDTLKWETREIPEYSPQIEERGL